MTWTCSLKRKPGYASVTTSLAVEMMSTARPGDWVEVEVDVMRAGGRVFFLNAFVKKGEERIARASATFQIVERPGTKREG
jgi:acyl-coenzyme A thioesterase PaaI-like protein